MKNTFESAFASRLDGGGGGGGGRPVAVVAPLRRSTNPSGAAAAGPSSSAAPSEGLAPAGAAPASPRQATTPQCVSLQAVGEVPFISVTNPERRSAEVEDDGTGNHRWNASSSSTSTSNKNNNHSEKSDEESLPRRSSSSSSGDSVVLGGWSPSSPIGPSSQKSLPGGPPCRSSVDRSGDYADAVVHSNFYYGTLTNAEAKSRLHRTPVGTFLLRDSSDRRFRYSLSVKTSRGTTSIRISGTPSSSSSGPSFRLDSDPSQKSQMPAFGSVLELVEHYHLGALASSSSSSSSKRRSHCVLLESSGRSDTPMVLRRPLELSPAPLAHLCRRLVNSLVASETKRMALIERMAHVDRKTKDQLKQYLFKYPFRV